MRTVLQCSSDPESISEGRWGQHLTFIGARVRGVALPWTWISCVGEGQKMWEPDVEKTIEQDRTKSSGNNIKPECVKDQYGLNLAAT